MKRSYAQQSKRKRHEDVVAFQGYNNTENHNDKDLFDMKNISGQDYPVITPREPREVVNTLTDGKMIFASDQLCYVDGLDFYYNGVNKGTLTNDPTDIVEMNDFIVIFPDEVYYDKVNDLWGSFTSGYTIEHATVNDNRMFAVSGNQLIASKQGDFETWDSFQGISTDSFAADVATQGDFKGITTFQDHVTAFKDHYIHELYGNMPSNYTIPQAIKKDCVDVRSVSELNGRLIFLASDGVYRYAGGLPRKFSQNVDMAFVSGIGQAFKDKYYINIYDGTDYHLFVFYERLGLWFREDNIQIKDFCVFNNSLYALTATNEIIKFNSGSETIDWSIETHEFDQMVFANKTYTELYFNIKVEPTTSLIIYLSKDGGDYEVVKSLSFDNKRHYRIPIMVRRANNIQLKIEGSGPVEIRNMSRVYIQGGEL